MKRKRRKERKCLGIGPYIGIDCPWPVVLQDPQYPKVWWCIRCLREYIQNTKAVDRELLIKCLREAIERDPSIGLES